MRCEGQLDLKGKKEGRGGEEKNKFFLLQAEDGKREVEGFLGPGEVYKGQEAGGGGMFHPQ